MKRYVRETTKISNFLSSVYRWGEIKKGSTEQLDTLEKKKIINYIKSKYGIKQREFHKILNRFNLILDHLIKYGDPDGLGGTEAGIKAKFKKEDEMRLEKDILFDLYHFQRDDENIML